MPRQQGQVLGHRGGGGQARPVLCGCDRTTMEETVRQPQVQHEAQWPEDLLLLGRLRVEVEGRGEGVRRQVENPAAAHHLQPHHQSCRLCLSEKYTIMFEPEMATLNKRDEFFTPCMHKQNKLLDKTWLCNFYFRVELFITCTVDTFVFHHLFNWRLWRHMKQIVLNILIKLVWI